MGAGSPCVGTAPASRNTVVSRPNRTRTRPPARTLPRTLWPRRRPRTPPNRLLGRGELLHDGDEVGAVGLDLDALVHVLQHALRVDDEGHARGVGLALGQDLEALRDAAVGVR